MKKYHIKEKIVKYLLYGLCLALSLVLFPSFWHGETHGEETEAESETAEVIVPPEGEDASEETKKDPGLAELSVLTDPIGSDISGNPLFDCLQVELQIRITGAEAGIVSAQFHEIADGNEKVTVLEVPEPETEEVTEEETTEESEEETTTEDEQQTGETVEEDPVDEQPAVLRVTSLEQTIFMADEANGIQAWVTYETGDGEIISSNEIVLSVDRSAPYVEINGVQNGSSVSGDAEPCVYVRDVNLSAESIFGSLSGMLQGDTGSPSVIVGNSGDILLQWENLSEDDIYTLEISCMDLAGHISRQTLRFTLNRNGSRYALESGSTLNGTVVREVTEDLVVTEQNLDLLEEDSIAVIMARNGILAELNRGEDYAVTVSGGENSPYLYTYVIGKEQFLDDGSYQIYFSSLDRAGNQNSSIQQESFPGIWFSLDCTDPLILRESAGETAGEDGGEKEISVVIKDNQKLAQVSITAGGEEIPYQVEDDTYLFIVPDDLQGKEVKIIAEDEAGNAFEKILQEEEPADTLQEQETEIKKDGNDSILSIIYGLAFVVTGMLWLCIRQVSKRKQRK